MPKTKEELLIEEIKETNRLLKKSLSRKHSFVRGIWVALGTIVGGSLFIALLIWFLTWLKVIPVIGTPAGELLKYVEIRYNAVP